MNTTRTENSDWDADNWRHLTEQSDSGSRITTHGVLTLSAGRDITAAADITADSALVAQAQRDIRLNAGRATTHLSEHSKQSSSGLLSSLSLETHDEVHEHRALSTTLSGDTVQITSGRNLTVSGSNIVATQDISLNAGHNLSVTSAAESHQETHLRKEKKSGLISSDGIDFAMGSASQKVISEQTDTLNHGSLVGSNSGNTILKAGHQTTVHGSDLMAGKNITLTGSNVNITAAENSHTALTQSEQKQRGLIVALSGTVGSALNTGVNSLQQARKENDSRLSALQNTKAVLSGIQAAQAYEYDQAQTEAAKAKNGDNGAALGATNTIGIRASYGSQSSKSEIRTENHQAQGSTIMAGENLSVVADGQNRGAQSGDIAITGSMLKAGQELSLDAARDIHLHSALNTETTTSQNSNKGGSTGVGIDVGADDYEFNVSASLNADKGHENGNSLTHTNTTLDSERNLSLTSGRDTILKGAQSHGEKMIADIGRNLTLQSQQDSDHYHARQQSLSAGGSLSFGPSTASGHLSATQDTLNSHFDSVKEQTGLFVGKGGYDVNVKDHTQLDGAVLDSLAPPDKNRLDTGTLGWNDIHNKADFTTEHLGVSMNSGGSVGKNLLTNMAGNMQPVTRGNNSARASGENITEAVKHNLGLQPQRDSDNRPQNLITGDKLSLSSLPGVSSFSKDLDKIQRTVDKVKNYYPGLSSSKLAGNANPDVNSPVPTMSGMSAPHNLADYSSQHINNLLKNRGTVDKKLLTRMQPGDRGHTEGITRAGVSEGTLIIRDTASQQQNIARLNRNTADANAGSISPIFDKEKEQKRLRQAQLVSEIGSQALEIYHTHEAIKATRAATRTRQDSEKWQVLQHHAKKTLNDEQRKNPLVDNSTQAVNDRAWQQAYDTALTRQGAQMGGNVRTATHAVVGALQALAGGDIQAALAQGAAPYLAAQVKNTTTGGKPHSELSTQEKLNNVVAHALLGGVIAELSYGNSIAGATGAATGELAAPAIALALYGTADNNELTSQQKENLSSLATLASGIAAGVGGDSAAGAVVGAQAGKNAVENNALGSVLAAAEANKKGTVEKYEDGTQAAIKEACSGGTPISCELAVAAMGTVISPWILPEAMAISGAIGAGAVGAIDYGLTGSVDPKNVIGAYWTGALTRYTGFKSTVAINAASGAITSYIDGKNPFLYGTISGVGGAIGYGIGNKIITPIADDILNPTWKTLRWDDIGMGISRPSTLNPIPGIIGTTGGGFAGETFNVLTDPKVPLENEKEARNDR